MLSLLSCQCSLLVMQNSLSVEDTSMVHWLSIGVLYNKTNCLTMIFSGLHILWYLLNLRCEKDLSHTFFCLVFLISLIYLLFSLLANVLFLKD